MLQLCAAHRTPSKITHMHVIILTIVFNVYYYTIIPFYFGDNNLNYGGKSNCNAGNSSVTTSIKKEDNIDLSQIPFKALL